MKDAPYYHGLRNTEGMQAMERIQQMATMIVWAQDVQGIVKMSDVPRKTLYRSKTEKPIRKKTNVFVTRSVPMGALSSSVSNSTISSTIDDDVCYDFYSPPRTKGQDENKEIEGNETEEGRVNFREL